MEPECQHHFLNMWVFSYPSWHEEWLVGDLGQFSLSQTLVQVQGRYAESESAAMFKVFQT